MGRKMVCLDGNEAVARVAHKTNDVIAIYPITPSSNMGEWSDMYSAKGEKNLWGSVPGVTEMQSEGAAAAAVHGALQAGALSTTFTCSQGLLLMIPTMFKVAGELTPTVFHISARSVACQALSIFGEHSDIYACRQTGYGMLNSNSVQEAMDFALITQSVSLKTRIPFIHFFDGFRTSHEVNKIEELTMEDMRAMIDEEDVIAHHKRGMNPDSPTLRGTSQNPDVFFQGRETVNPFYKAVPGIAQKVMDQFAEMTGRQYKIYEYFGAADAEKVIIIMASGGETVHETVEYLMDKGEKVGVLKCRLFRPFSVEDFVAALPDTVKAVAVMDRTKEPGSAGEPLYQDVLNAFVEMNTAGKMGFAFPTVISGRFGLSSKEFTPAMVKRIYDELGAATPKNHFTIGINDDVSGSSLEYDADFSTEDDSVFRGMFYGLGADGTIGANKNTIKIIGEETDNYAQGYFVYDSKKSGSMTVSHVRFGPKKIRSTYLITKANFIGCHQFVFLEKYDILKNIVEGGTFLINSTYGADEIWDKLPRVAQERIIEKKLKVYTIDAYTVAREAGMGGRINTVMQTCFFAISGILPKDEAIEKIKNAAKKTYASKGEKIVQMNFNAIDQSLANLNEVAVPATATSTTELLPMVSADAPEFVKDLCGKILGAAGETIPVSKMPADGVWPTATSQWEKRNICLEVPVWDSETCIQCNKCANVCPHAVIRPKIYDKSLLAKAPGTFKSVKAKGKEFGENDVYTLQVSVEDCTGCALCVDVCPAKNKEEVGKKAINMAPQIPLRAEESKNWYFFLNELPDFDRTKLNHGKVKDSQFLRPLFEFSGACAGCGETPYVKLLSQLFGDRMMIGNATGCSSIYGGNLPTTPWAVDANGRGATWCNSLFEDTAEFAMGLRLSVDAHWDEGVQTFTANKDVLGAELVDAVLTAEQKTDNQINEQRARVADLKKAIQASSLEGKERMLMIADYMVKKSVWGHGGDGWAYDIGFGGLDHVLASGKNVNLLVMDTEVYSNTGGQMSKATPMGSIAKFAAGGKPIHKKDLAMIAMSYGYVYVAQIAQGANDAQALKAILEAEAYDGPSIVIAYSHCIAHGITMSKGMQHQTMAVESGHWPLFRYNPELALEGKNPFQLDSKAPKLPVADYMQSETRYAMLKKIKPEAAEEYMKLRQELIDRKWTKLEKIAQMSDF